VREGLEQKQRMVLSRNLYRRRRAGFQVLSFQSVFDLQGEDHTRKRAHSPLGINRAFIRGMISKVLIAKAKKSALALALLACSWAAGGVPNALSISRQTVRYQCDANGTSIGLPPGIFSVEYINAGGNSSVAVPISGKTLILSSAIAAGGVRYTAQQYTWWDAKGSVTLSVDSLNGKVQSACRRVNPH
jgi:membrane-bound inhibitor of C-type lysozyme